MEGASLQTEKSGLLALKLISRAAKFLAEVYLTRTALMMPEEAPEQCLLEHKIHMLTTEPVAALRGPWRSPQVLRELLLTCSCARRCPLVRSELFTFSGQHAHAFLCITTYLCTWFLLHHGISSPSSPALEDSSSEMCTWTDLTDTDPQSPGIAMWPTNAQDHAQTSLCNRSLVLMPLGSTLLGYSPLLPFYTPWEFSSPPSNPFTSD